MRYHNLGGYFKHLLVLALLCALLAGCSNAQQQTEIDNTSYSGAAEASQTDIGDAQQQAAGDTPYGIPVYTGRPYVELNGNIPEFTDAEKNTNVFETYSELDSLGRCQAAYANVCQEIMPAQKRGPIGNVKPTGWHTVNYHELIDGNYLYNRCHLIAYELAGENANEKNLITGTRYLNITGMLPFENKVAAFVKSTGYHVLYRVTPVFYGSNLVASGVQMEAWSVEDNGQGICFNIYAYNVQPGIYIDYATGDSHVADNGQAAGTQTKADNKEQHEYILNTKNMKFHSPDCSSVSKMSDKNKQTFTGTREQVIEMGYEACGVCKP